MFFHRFPDDFFFYGPLNPALHPPPCRRRIPPRPSCKGRLPPFILADPGAFRTSPNFHVRSVTRSFFEAPPPPSPPRGCENIMPCAVWVRARTFFFCVFQHPLQLFISFPPFAHFSRFAIPTSSALRVLDTPFAPLYFPRARWSVLLCFKTFFLILDLPLLW